MGTKKAPPIIPHTNNKSTTTATTPTHKRGNFIDAGASATTTTTVGVGTGGNAGVGAGVGAGVPDSTSTTGASTGSNNYDKIVDQGQQEGVKTVTSQQNKIEVIPSPSSILLPQEKEQLQKADIALIVKTTTELEEATRTVVEEEEEEEESTTMPPPSLSNRDKK